jgi:hypothetical protein
MLLRVDGRKTRLPEKNRLDMRLQISSSPKSKCKGRETESEIHFTSSNFSGSRFIIKNVNAIKSRKISKFLRAYHNYRYRRTHTDGERRGPPTHNTEKVQLYHSFVDLHNPLACYVVTCSFSGFQPPRHSNFQLFDERKKGKFLCARRCC